MSNLDRAVLVLEADVDGDGTTETGEFVLASNTVVTEQVQKAYKFDNTLSSVISVFSQIPGLEDVKRQGLFLDLGGGSHIIEIQFMGWEGATYTDANGNKQAAQWGDGSGTFPADATQEDPLKQIQCFQNYLKLSTTDSFAPAKLYWGEYSDGTYAPSAGGFNEPLNVAVQGPRNTHAAEDYSTFDGTFTAIEVFKLSNPIDLTARTKRGT